MNYGKKRKQEKKSYPKQAFCRLWKNNFAILLMITKSIIKLETTVITLENIGAQHISVT